jgi:serine phosphatase RsbU (regulator of sigma subunit)/uncharacterized protein HemY
MNRTLFLFLFFILIAPVLQAQDKNVSDSLTRIAEKNPADTNSLNAYIDLSKSTINSDFNKSLAYALNALDVANQLDDNLSKGKAYLQIGNCHYSYSHSKEAIENFHTAISFFELSGSDKSYLGKCYNNIGNTEKKMGRNKDAMESYLQSKKLYEDGKNKKGMAGIYNNIGNILLTQNQQGKAKEYFFLARQMNIEINNKPWLGINLMNIGICYFDVLQYDSAEFYFLAAMKIYKEENEMSNWAAVVMNLGNVYQQEKDYEKSLAFYNQALDFDRKTGKEADIAFLFCNIAESYISEGIYDKALRLLDSSVILSVKYEDPNSLVAAYKGYSSLYEKTGDFKNAHAFYKLYASMKDSLGNADMKSQMDQMEESFRDEKQKKEIELLTQKNLMQKQEGELKDVHANIVIYSSVGIAIFVLGLSVILYKRYQLKKKANIVLEERNQQIELKNAIIEEKNKDISDSINYAKKIQDTLLPEMHELETIFSESFVFFRPKNVVSGDFYWFYKTRRETDSEIILVAAADCTGHGVPGAFMSMIGIDKMNQAVLEFDISHPQEILSTVNRWLKTILKQDDETGGMRDGMDVALISIDPTTMRMEFSGANRPLWVIRDETLIEIPSTKASLGGHTPILQEFSTHNFELKKNDCIYLFTDGYADQFGGERGKKLMSKHFKRLLLSIIKEPMEKQKKILEDTLIKWMGKHDQVDDICVIGIRI